MDDWMKGSEDLTGAKLRIVRHTPRIRWWEFACPAAFAGVAVWMICRIVSGEMTYEMMVRYSLCLPWAVICVCVLALINPISGLIENVRRK